MIVNTGKELMARLLIGNTGRGVLNSSCKLAVGSSDRAASATDQGLPGWLAGEPMSPGYPKVGALSNNQIKVAYRATFGPNTANGPWKEWGLITNSNPATLFNREVVNNGTKVKGQTWIFNVEITYVRG